jgi:membrane protein required for colicin V production
MTIFDLIAFAVIVWSALSGANRGVVSELVGLFAVALSAIATIVFLPATAAIARQVLHSGWIAAVSAAVVTFIVVFLFLRLLANTLTNSINKSFLSGANRFGGLAFGALRGALFLALFALVFNRVTPQALKPGWITGALAYPLATDGANVLQGLMPKKLDLTGGFGDRLTKSIKDESVKSDDQGAPAETTPGSEDAPFPAAPSPQHNPPPSERAKPANHGYTKHARDSVDALVERSK